MAHTLKIELLLQFQRQDYENITMYLPNHAPKHCWTGILIYGPVWGPWAPKWAKNQVFCLGSQKPQILRICPTKLSMPFLFFWSPRAPKMSNFKFFCLRSYNLQIFRIYFYLPQKTISEKIVGAPLWVNVSNKNFVRN